MPVLLKDVKIQSFDDCREVVYCGFNKKAALIQDFYREISLMLP